MKNTEHDKIVDAYNPYYQYFDERYKVRIGKKQRRKKKRSPTSIPKKVSSFKNFRLIT
uniref:Uncharacterized protein n=1 Tax=Onchocerca volvulus TaxID=6282 RepID=A0A8R1XPE9_ONCVO